SASALVNSPQLSAIGFLIDREERLLLTTQRVTAQADEVEVIFPIIENNKATVNRSLWIAKAKNQLTKGRILIADPQRDLAVILLNSVPDGVPELKLAKGTPEKDAPVTFLGAAPKSDLVWAPAASTIQKLGPREVPMGDTKTTNQMIEL